MEIAQELFESGFITYHRTDSTRVSAAGMAVAREYISEKFGPEFVKLRPWGEGGAHECIRPTRPLDAAALKTMVTVSGSTAKMSEEHFKVYDLIFRRFMASQMVPVVVKEAELSLRPLPFQREFREVFITEVVKDGWNLIEPLKVRQLPVRLEKGKTYTFPVLSYLKKEAPKVYPYTQGELVEEMKKRGIGRPSTYAKIVQTLLERKYVVQRGRFLYPTKLGIEVYAYLREKFPHYTSEEFTREIEELMDRVERGEVDYQEVIKGLKPVLRFAREALQENLTGE